LNPPLKVSGADIKNWLESAARRFRQIDPKLTTEQPLIGTMPGYNFDMFTDKDVSYEIDVTQAAGDRIRKLTYKGILISPTAEFIVATNNYRASGGGSFPGIDGTKTIYASQDTNRDVLIEYVKRIKNLRRSENGLARSWRFTPVVIAGPVTFKSARGKLALAQAAGLSNIQVFAEDDGSGKDFSTYQIDLSK
jgi:2',3'-cyclic-nucleotide 2'-phosphodiesterase / 3'-nucleotidase